MQSQQKVKISNIYYVFLNFVSVLA